MTGYGLSFTALLPILRLAPNAPANCRSRHLATLESTDTLPSRAHRQVKVSARSNCRILIIRSSKDTPEALRQVCGSLGYRRLIIDAAPARWQVADGSRLEVLRRRIEYYLSHPQQKCRRPVQQ